MDEENEVIAVMTAENHKEIGNQKYREKDYLGAIDCYSEAIKLDPSNPAFLNNRSAAYIMVNKYGEALEDSGRSCELDPSQVKSLMRYGKCHLMMGNWDSAIDSYNSVLQVDPGQTEAANQLNIVSQLKKHYDNYFNQCEKEDYRHALFSIERCIEASPGSINFKLHKAEVLINMKKFSDAKLVLEDFLQRNGQSSSPEALYLRGLCLYYLEHLEKAQSHFQHVLRLNPDHIKAQQAYKRSKLIMKLKEEGNQFVKSRQYDKAYGSYTEALAVDKLHDLLNAKLYSNRSFASFNLKNYEAALEDSNKAIELDSTYTKAQLRKAKCLIALEKYQDAVYAMEKLCENDNSEEHRQMLKEAKLELKKSKRKDYYKILGVAKDANENDIKKAYRKRALLHHPDRHAHEDETKRKLEEQKFKEVGEAYNVLSDTKKRQRYDNGADIDELDNDGCRGYGVDPYDLFQQMFRDNGFGASGASHFGGFHSGGGGNTFSFSFG